MNDELEELEDSDNSLELEQALDVEDRRHPLLEDFLLQYPSCYEEAADRAFLIHQELTEVQDWWFTQMCFSEQLERPYIVGQETRDGKQQIVLPLAIEEQFSTRDIQALLAYKDGMQKSADEILLAFNDFDSSLVCYKLMPGLQPPEPPEIVSEKKRNKKERQNKKRQHLSACVRKAIERLNKEDT